MSTAWTRIARMLGIVIPTSIAVMAMASGTAWAQTTYDVYGSDTLTEVIVNSIAASGARINYHNTGSGQAENNMSGGLTGSQNSIQGIGPMSRNFQQNVLTAHPTWQPGTSQALALDAGVLAVANIGGHCSNVNAALVDTSNPTIAQITTDLSIILSGYPAGGAGTKSKATTAECADSRRLTALNNLTSCMGVNRIDHIYRRDDKSGTQDTFREHLQFDRWCNGKSEGNTNAAGSNLKNEDLDPIRRSCIGADATKAQTRCTYYPLATTCTAGAADIVDATYGTLKCTQGLIVALSENDPGSKDITISMGNRIAQDINGYTMGLAGLAVVGLSGQPTIGTNINSVTYEEGNIRGAQYMFARRLFLQRKNNADGHPAGSGDPDSGRDVQENKLYDWALNRCNIHDIVVNAGFLPPLPDCHSACDDPLNMTCLQSDPGAGTPKQNIGAELTAGTGELCDGSHPCVATGATCVTGGNCAQIPALASTYECNINAKCTGGTCNLSGLAGVCQ